MLSTNPQMASLATASLATASWKTAFLVAIPSAKHCGDLQAFRSDSPPLIWRYAGTRWSYIQTFQVVY